MNAINSKAIEKRVLKEQRDNLANLVNLGLVSNDLASDHGIWQGYRRIMDSTSGKDLPSEELISVKDTIKAYASKVEEAINFGLIENPAEESFETIYTKSL